LGIIATMLLFIMGMAFLSTTMTEKVTVSNVQQRDSLDQAVDAVVQQIDTVLRNDLVVDYGGVHHFLDGTISNEYMDYPNHQMYASADGALGTADDSIIHPGTGTFADGDEDTDFYWKNSDIWLASLEPELIDIGADVGAVEPRVPGYRHITDIYGRLAFLFHNSYERDLNDGSLIGGLLYSDVEGDRISFRNLPATIIQAGAPIVQEGDKADADGDGVADARWVLIPNLRGPQGEYLYAAVRIIDNCGMINVNTAFRDPTSLTGTPDDWDGSKRTHVNLEGIRKDGSTAPADALYQLHLQRLGSSTNPYGASEFQDATYDQRYEDEIAQRVLNPFIASAGLPYQPFDLSDELELRNRGFLNSPVLAASEYVWPKTFLPGGSSTLKLPYTEPAELGIWYAKASSFGGSASYTEGNYARRHITTAYSFDRVMVPKRTSTWPPAGMPQELSDAWKDWNKWNEADKSKWAYKPVCIDNVIDSTDTDQTVELLAAAIWLSLDAPSISPAKGFNLTMGSESMDRTDLACQLAVNLVDYVDDDGGTPKATSLDLPSVTRTYYGYESKADGVYISEIAKAQDGGGTNNAYAIELYNPGPASVSLSGWKLDVAGTPIDFPVGQSVPATGTKVFTATTDSTTFPASTAFSTPGTDWPALEFADDERITLLRTEGSDEVPVDSLDSGASGVSAGTTVAGTRGDWFVRDQLPIWETSVSWASGAFLSDDLGSFSPDRGSYPEVRSQLLFVADNSGSLKTVGEFSLILGVGGRKSGTDYWSIPEWLGAYKLGADVRSITAGRIDPTHEDFADLFRFVTTGNFNPFSDKCDDGTGNMVDLDNDGDGQANEDTELAVAGRININTAPWFVIAQLPWIVDPGLAVDAAERFKLAQAITGYRDKQDLTQVLGDASAPNYTDRKVGMGTTEQVRDDDGIASIGELLNVTHDLDGAGTYDEWYDTRRYGRNENAGNPINDNQAGEAPFYSTDAGENDSLERDVLFHRMSNLVTVRSDVFTAYILVRLGERGPERRVMAILDRSNVFKPTDAVRVVALHPVPDPR